jgi:hypothetical protein
MALLVLLVLAAGVRMWNFPQRYEVRDVDEMGYISGGLVLLEGIQPGYKASGAGIETWLGWLYAAGQATEHMMDRNGAEAAAPFALRPYLAVNHALFDIYSDMSGLRNFLLVEQLVVSLIAVWMGFRLGRARAGLAGAILIGGFVAIGPLFVDYVATSRPYADAWALAIIAIAYAATSRSPNRAIWTGILFGLSVSSRIDMIVLLPLVWWELWYRDGWKGIWRRVAVVTLVAMITMLILAPWLTTGLIGNVRMIMSYRVVGIGAKQTRIGTMVDIMWRYAFGPLVALMGVGLVLMMSKRRWLAALAMVYAGVLVLSAFTGAQNSVKYQGATMTAVVIAAALALGMVHSVRPKWSVAIALALLIVPAVQTVRMVLDWKRRYVAGDEIAWVQQHVPAGTTVYCAATIRKLLPTTESADRMWNEVTSPQSWKRKIERGLVGANVQANELPRALSEENMVLDRSNLRGYFILGSTSVATTRPRYDVRLYKFSPLFGTQDVVGGI